MQKLKSGVLVSILTIGIITTAMANQNTAAPVQPFTDTDIQLIFKQDNQPMELAALSPKEMRETEGALGLGGAIIGGVGGGAGYLISTHISGSNFSWGQLGTTMALSAAHGAAAGPVGIVWGFNSAIAGGVLHGAFGRP